MTAEPAQLRDGLVVLEPEGAALCALALETALRSRQCNGGALTGQLRRLASVLALAAPGTTVHLPALLTAAGPDVARAVHAQASELDATGKARQARQAAGSVAAAPPQSSLTGPLLTPDVARLTGLTTDAVRAAIRRGRLKAHRDRITGQWRTTAEAVENWRSGRAA